MYAAIITGEACLAFRYRGPLCCYNMLYALVFFKIILCF